MKVHAELEFNVIKWRLPCQTRCNAEVWRHSVSSCSISYWCWILRSASLLDVEFLGRELHHHTPFRSRSTEGRSTSETDHSTCIKRLKVVVYCIHFHRVLDCLVFTEIVKKFSKLPGCRGQLVQLFLFQFFVVIELEAPFEQHYFIVLFNCLFDLSSYNTFENIQVIVDN